MDAARHLARRVEPGDDVALRVEHLRLLVDLHAAHRIMDARYTHQRVERPLVQLIAEPLAPEFRILVVLDVAVVGLTVSTSVCGSQPIATASSSIVSALTRYSPSTASFTC